MVAAGLSFVVVMFMSAAAKIIWIASYPKSGNTWMRMLVGNYMYGAAATPMPLNEIGAHIPADRDETLYRGYCLRHQLSFDEVAPSLAHRDAMYAELLAAKGPMFIKTHACNHEQNGTAYYPPARTHGTILIVRDPRDVVLSFAHHTQRTPDQALAMMRDQNFVATQNGMTEFLSSWDQHTKSFLGMQTPKMIIRYEDLLADAAAVLRRVLSAFGEEVDEARLQECVKFSAFDSLKSQEGKDGFVENPNAGQSFFRAGTANQWQQNMTPELVDATQAAFGPVMEQLGYL